MGSHVCDLFLLLSHNPYVQLTEKNSAEKMPKQTAPEEVFEVLWGLLAALKTPASWPVIAAARLGSIGCVGKEMQWSG